MADRDLVHRPGHHPPLPSPKTLRVRSGGANSKAAAIFQQMMDDAQAADVRTLNHMADGEPSRNEEPELIYSTSTPPTLSGLESWLPEQPQSTAEVEVGKLSEQRDTVAADNASTVCHPASILS